jgi:hypothetical protein
MLNFRQRPILTLLTTISVAALVMAAFSWQFFWRIFVYLSQQNQTGLGSLGSAIQSIVGTAVGLGASIGTVYLAFAALRLVEQQDRRDDAARLFDFIRQGIGPIQRVAMAVSRVYESRSYLVEKLDVILANWLKKSNAISAKHLLAEVLAETDGQSSSRFSELKKEILPIADHLRAEITQLIAAVENLCSSS